MEHSQSENARAREGENAGDTATFDRAIELVRFLRKNCSWDAAQTPESLLPYLLEEAHEVADAVSAKNENNLESELGDLLLNVAFQVVLAEERGAFSADDVVKHLEAKMRRRHPHLYGDGPPVPWEELKARERKDEQLTFLSGIASGLDPLSRAHRIQERVSTVGFDWADARGAFEKVAEEIEEVREAMEAGQPEAMEEELGDLLFAVVNLARLSGAHSLHALQRANAKFIGRFDKLEQLAKERGIVLGEASLDVLDGLWNEIKKTGNREPKP